MICTNLIVFHWYLKNKYRKDTKSLFLYYTDKNKQSIHTIVNLNSGKHKEYSSSKGMIGWNNYLALVRLRRKRESILDAINIAGNHTIFTNRLLKQFNKSKSRG